MKEQQSSVGCGLLWAGELVQEASDGTILVATFFPCPCCHIQQVPPQPSPVLGAISGPPCLPQGQRLWMNGQGCMPNSAGLWEPE